MEISVSHYLFAPKLYVTSRYGYRNHPITGRYRLHEGIDFPSSNWYTRLPLQRLVQLPLRQANVVTVRQFPYNTKTTSVQFMGTCPEFMFPTVISLNRGRVIGLTGSSGHSTGPHLHFEIRYKGKSENPARHLDLR